MILSNTEFDLIFIEIADELMSRTNPDHHSEYSKTNVEDNASKAKSFKKSIKIKFWEVARCGCKPDRQCYSCGKESYLNNRILPVTESQIMVQC